MLETSFKSLYKGGSTFPEIDEFMKQSGFNYIASDNYGKKFPSVGFRKRREGEFNVLYSRLHS